MDERQDQSGDPVTQCPFPPVMGITVGPARPSCHCPVLWDWPCWAPAPHCLLPQREKWGGGAALQGSRLASSEHRAEGPCHCVQVHTHCGVSPRLADEDPGDQGTGAGAGLMSSDPLLNVSHADTVCLSAASKEGWVWLREGQPQPASSDGGSWWTEGALRWEPQGRGPRLAATSVLVCRPFMESSCGVGGQGSKLASTFCPLIPEIQGEWGEGVIVPQLLSEQPVTLGHTRDFRRPRGHLV